MFLIAFDIKVYEKGLSKWVVIMCMSTPLYSMLECPCCGSKFSIYDGFPASGPAKWQLKEYSTTFTGNTVRIYN